MQPIETRTVDYCHAFSFSSSGPGKKGSVLPFSSSFCQSLAVVVHLRTNSTNFTSARKVAHGDFLHVHWVGLWVSWLKKPSSELPLFAMPDDRAARDRCRSRPLIIGSDSAIYVHVATQRRWNVRTGHDRPLEKVDDDDARASIKPKDSSQSREYRLRNLKVFDSYWAQREENDMPETLVQ